MDAETPHGTGMTASARRRTPRSLSRGLRIRRACGAPCLALPGKGAHLRLLPVSTSPEARPTRGAPLSEAV